MPTLKDLWAEHLNKRAFQKAAKADGYNPQQIREYIASLSADHHAAPRVSKKTQRKIVAYPPKKIGDRIRSDCWQADLLDLVKYQGSNSKTRYILVVVDVFSRYVFAEPCRTKESAIVEDAFLTILDRAKHWPKNLNIDQGGEFADVKKWCAANGTRVYLEDPDRTGTHPAIAERMNRTIRASLKLLFAMNKNKTWTTDLPRIVKGINNRENRTTGEKPTAIYNGTKTPSDAPPVKHKQKFDWGDVVRIYIPKKRDETHKKKFARKTDENHWTRDVYFVVKTHKHSYEVEHLKSGELYPRKLLESELKHASAREQAAPSRAEKRNARDEDARAHARRIRRAGLDDAAPTLPRARRSQARKTRSDAPQRAPPKAKAKAKAKPQKFTAGDFVRVNSLVAQVIDDSNQVKLELREFKQVGDTDKWRPSKHVKWVESHTKCKLLKHATLPRGRAHAVTL